MSSPRPFIESPAPPDPHVPSDLTEEHASRMLSYVLRHDPKKINVHLDKNGWAPIWAVLAGFRADNTPLSEEMLRQVVANNDKQRFAISEDGRNIRANQGHSASLGIHVGLKKAVPPTILYHGTKDRFLERIQQQGLLPMTRTHVHLSADPISALVVGDRRKGMTVILNIDAKAMLEDGLPFYLSENGIWMVDAVPTKYLTVPNM